MTGKIFRNSFLLGATVLLLCAILFFGVQYAQTTEETYAALRQEAIYAANGVMLSGEEYLRTLGTGNRITWINGDGSVRYDSESGAELPNNQQSFPEVKEALKDGEGHGIRRSENSGAQTMYYAIRCQDGTVLRLSRPLSALRYALIAVSPVLWIFVLVLIISGILAFQAAKQLIQPINALELDDPDASKIYPELAPLVERIRDQNLTIREQMDELNRKQKEFAALTDNMSEGFVLTDRTGTVLSANNGAVHMIRGCEEGAKLTETSDPTVAEALTAALAGSRAERVLPSGDQSLQLIVNPVVPHGRVTGAVLLIVDVTEREQRERLRREFSANVSHELKTPLTSISGFAELMMQEMVSADKVKEFSGDIYRESQRMIALVEDIIKLSKLDEQEEAPPFSEVDLYGLAEDTLDSLRSLADKRNIVLSLSGEHVTVRGVEQFLDEIFYNLCDNAIKYNLEGGRVEVLVSGEEDTATVTVRDTGIGIPYEHQNRVFERFYRVNKSHSKEVAGTGLGLSIVKHAAQVHGAAIRLESEPGVGTAVTLTFPRDPAGSAAPGGRRKDEKE